MTAPTTLVLGGTGTLGAQLLPLLLRERGRVRVMTRQPQSHAALAHLGAELVMGDLIDQESVRSACQGVSKVVLACHSLLGRGRHASPAVDGVACQRAIDMMLASGVRRCVYLSVHGADAGHPLGFWRTKAQRRSTCGRAACRTPSSGLPLSWISTRKC